VADCRVQLTCVLGIGHTSDTTFDNSGYSQKAQEVDVGSSDSSGGFGIVEVVRTSKVTFIVDLSVDHGFVALEVHLAEY
jgi:hypothetical protein